jgi:hypothetical protein
MKATLPDGSLIEIENCYIEIPELNEIIYMKILPEISDSKGANYSDQTAIGRSFPIKNYAYSENRSISWTIHLMVCKESDKEDMLKKIKLIEACVYPSMKQQPYSPPPICYLKCGRLLAEVPLCCVLKNYTLRFPTDVVWDDESCLPNKLDLELSFDVVYDSKSLPYAEEIQELGW